MLKAELRKTWSRPLVIIAFLIICFVQVYYVTSNYNPNTREASNLYNKLGGVMARSWSDRVHDRFDELWPTPPQSNEEIWNATLEQSVILDIYDATFFTELLDRYVESAKNYYGTDPDFDLSRIDHAYAPLRKASENGTLIYGMSPTASCMTNQYMVTWCFLIFMTILCVDQFSGEKQTGMVPMQNVTKQGRRKLFRAKFAVCQLSALFVWVICNVLYAVSLTVAYGWGNLESIVQDFNYNACPYTWNAGQFLAVVLTVSFIASQVVAALIFLLARIGGSTQKSFALMGGLLILPYLIAFQADIPAFYVWLPCLMHGSWLWTGLRYWKVLGIYVQPWQIGVVELILVSGLVALGLRRFEQLAECADEQ